MPLPIKDVYKDDYWITFYMGSTNGGYYYHKNYPKPSFVDCYTFGNNKQPATINLRNDDNGKKYWGYIDEDGVEWEVNFI